MPDLKKLIRSKPFRIAWILLVIGLVINALDFFGGQQVVARKGLIVRHAFLAETRYAILQWWGVWALSGVVLWRLPSAISCWRGWRIPMFARVVLTLLLVVEGYHIVVRKEVYPFSNIGMYSLVRVRTIQPTHVERSYFIQDEGAWKEFNLFREGNRALKQFVYIGPKTASILKRTFGHEKAIEYIDGRVAEEGYPPLYKGSLVVEWKTLEVTKQGPEAADE